jgi:hypothetical protein
MGKFMMRWWLSGVVLTLLFMVFQLPAAFVLSNLPTMPVPISFYQTKGTIWQGETCAQTPVMAQDPCLKWNWQPVEILAGNMAWAVAADAEQAKIDMLANVSTYGWQLKGGVVVDKAGVMPSWAQMMPVGATPQQKNISFQGVW